MIEGFIEEKEDGACYAGQPKAPTVEDLKQKIDLLKAKLLQSKPELADWIKLNFGD